MIENLFTFVRTLGNQRIQGKKFFVTQVGLLGTVSDNSGSIGTAGKVLSSTGSGVSWITVGTGSSDVDVLNDLSDVVISTATEGQLLRFNGTSWVNWTHPFLTSSSTLGDLFNVGNSADGANNGDILRFDEAAGLWVADEFPSFTESDTLDSVTDRGTTTTNSITVGGLSTSGTVTAAVVTTPLIEREGVLTINSEEQVDQGEPNPNLLYVSWFGDNKFVINADGYAIASTGYKVTGGTASGFLKANGTIDTSTYLTSYTETQTLDAVTDLGSTTTNNISVGGLTSTSVSTPIVQSNNGVLTITADSSGSLQPEQGDPAVKVLSFKWSTTEFGFLDTDGKIAFQGFKTPTGTASGFLKANGTVDTSAYITEIEYLDDIGDVVISTPATGDVLTFDGSEWVNSPIASADYVSKVQHEVKAGVAITKGQALYVTGADGTNIVVGKASNVSEAMSSKTIGLAAASAAVNGKFFVITEGLLAGLNTSAANVGDAVWLGVNGALIFGLTNKPVAPAHLVYIGVVTRKNANNGEIFISIQNGFELKELHDVLINGVTAGQLIRREADGLWKNWTPNYITANSVDTLLNKTIPLGTGIYEIFAIDDISGFAGQTDIPIYQDGIDKGGTINISEELIISVSNSGIGYYNGAVTTSGGTRFVISVNGNTLTGTLAEFNVALTDGTFATESYVGTQIANLVDSAPATLDTLNELAAALGDDANFATTVTTSIATKQPQLNGTGFVKASGTTISYDNSTYLTSESDPIFTGSAAYGITNENLSEWSQAYGWSDHATQGYLTSETDPVFTASPAYGIAESNITKWNTAYGWGDHSTFGYLTSLPAHTHAASDITSGTLSTDRLPKQELGISIAGNFGQWEPHGTYTNFNTDVAYWGWSYVQGTGNAPHTTSSQWYRGRFSLGSQYGLGSGGGDYWMEIAIPRYSQGNNAGNLFVRTAEDGVATAWQGVRGAYATNAAYAIASGNSETTDQTVFSTLFINDAAVATEHFVTSQGYINGESDPVFTGSVAYTITSENITNWDTAFSWGNHADYGYLTTLPDHNHDDRYYTETEINSLLGGKVSTDNFKVLGGGINYDIDRTLKVQSGLAIYGAYSGGTNSPFTYDIAAQFAFGNRAFEFSADWINEDGANLRLRTLRDCCNNWSPWVDVITSYNIGQYALTSLPAHNHDDRYYTETESDSRFYLATNPSGYITGISFANVSSKPTTIAGYGITDAITTANIGSQSVLYADSSGNSNLLKSLGSYVWSSSTNGRDFQQGLQVSFVSENEGYQSYGSVVRVHTYPNDGASAELYFPYSEQYGGNSMQYRLGLYPNAGWSSWKTVVDSENIGEYALTSLPAHTHTIANVTGLQTALDGKLFSDSDSEQDVGGRFFRFNNGINQINIDPRWNESGYDANLGVFHMYSTTASGAQWGRTGIALYSGTAYQYLTTKSGTTGVFLNNQEIIHSGNIGSQSVTYATSAGNADTVDSLHASSFLRSDVYNSNYGGLQVFRNIGTNDGSWPDADHTLGLENNDAGNIVINFHRSGYTSNNLRYNGTSFRFDLALESTGVITASGGNSTNWNTAYGWGNHATAGYLTSETDSQTLSWDKPSITLSISNGNSIALEGLATEEFVTGQGYITGSYLPLSGGTLSGAVVVNLGNVSSDTVAFKVGGPANYDSLTIGMEDTPDYDAFIASFGNDIRFYSGKGVATENHSFYWFTSKAGTAQHSVVAMQLDHNQNLTIGGTFTEQSSIRYKENVKSIPSVSQKVEKLDAVSYNKIGNKEEEIGLIAEDVAELFPEVVKYDNEGRPDGVNYSRLSVILLKAVQELTERVNKLENK